MSERVVVAFLKPADGKVDKVEQELRKMAKAVWDKEPNALRYHMHKEVGADKPTFVMTETYASQGDVDAHMKTSDFQNFIKIAEEESLFASPPEIITCVSTAGFESRQEGLKQ